MAYGDNIRFICTYLFENPGARYSEVRNALCEARGIDPLTNRGHYVWYFKKNRGRSWNSRTMLSTPRPAETRWEVRDGRYFLTQKGLAWVSVT
jgi:hypothetical protein